MVTSIMLGLVAFFSQCEYALGTSLLSRPIVTGVLTGLVMGDLKTGIIMGATFELALIGAFSVGAALPPEIISGGVLGTAFAIHSHAGTEAALLLGLPIATFALVLVNLYMVIILPIIVHKADRYAEEANTRGIEMMQLIGGFGLAAMIGLIVTISYYVGSDVISGLLHKIPGFIQTGLEVATGILPALGFAMLAKLLINKQVLPFFFLGFIIVAYLKIPVTGIAILGAIIAVVMVNMKQNQISLEEGAVNNNDIDEDF